MVWQILMRTRYDEDDPDKVGIVRLLSNGAYKAAYPLHDGQPSQEDYRNGTLSSRRVRQLTLITVKTGLRFLISVNSGVFTE